MHELFCDFTADSYKKWDIKWNGGHDNAYQHERLNIGGEVTWAFNHVDTDATVSFKTFAPWQMGDADVSFCLNGEFLEKNVAIPSEDKGTTQKEYKVKLNEGPNNLRIIMSEGPGMLFQDYIKVTSEKPAPSDKESEFTTQDPLLKQIQELARKVDEEAKIFGDPLTTGCAILPGGSLISKNREFKFTFQEDGNQCLYHVPSGNLLFEMLPKGMDTKNGQAIAVLQGDAHFCVYNSARTCTWASGLWGAKARNNKGPHRLVMQNDGDLVQYDCEGGWIWRTGTSGNKQASNDGKGWIKWC